MLFLLPHNIFNFHCLDEKTLALLAQWLLAQLGSYPAHAQITVKKVRLTLSSVLGRTLLASAAPGVYGVTLTGPDGLPQRAWGGSSICLFAQAKGRRAAHSQSLPTPGSVAKPGFFTFAAPIPLPRMLIRIVRMSFEPAQVPAFLALFRATEQRIREQPGCRHLELWQDADTPATYCTHSHWDDAAALNAYRKSTLFGEVWPATKRLFAAPPVAFSVNPVL